MSDRFERAECCGDCRFWDGLYPLEEGIGRCRRYAPRPVILDVEASFKMEACFPLTGDCDWCGEFKMRKDNQDE